MKKKLGIIGCGTIGAAVAKSVNKDKGHALAVSVLYDIDKDNADVLSNDLEGDVVIAKDVNDLISSCDIILEAASASVSGEIAIDALEADTDVMVMSVGGLVSAYDKLLDTLNKTNASLYVPSGALCGIDGVLAARCGGIESVRLTTRKPPKGLKGAPYLKEAGIDIDAIASETVIFEGPARDAIKAFPKNVNVAAVLSLAGIGVDKTVVRLLSSPDYVRNSHEIEVTGAFGSIRTLTENVPSPNNPKTSYMAVLAAEAMLKKISGSFKVGT